jgi:hypothetical protein
MHQDDINIKNIITYYESFASYKEKNRINSILRKETPTEWELQFLDNIQRRLNVLLKASEMNVESRLQREKNRVIPTSITQNNNKYH